MYKLGDEIIITGYQKNVEAMALCLGEKAVIRHVDKLGNFTWYSLDNSSYYWREDWLSPAESMTDINIKENEYSDVFRNCV